MPRLTKEEKLARKWSEYATELFKMDLSAYGMSDLGYTLFNGYPNSCYGRKPNLRRKHRNLKKGHRRK